MASLPVPSWQYVVEQVFIFFEITVLKVYVDVLSLSEGQPKYLGKDGKCMTNRCRTGTGGSSQELDRELSDVLITISVVSRRIADRLSVVSSGEKIMEGESQNGKSKRIVHAR